MRDHSTQSGDPYGDDDPFFGREPVARSLPPAARNRVRHRVAAARRLLTEAAEDAYGAAVADPIFAALAVLADADGGLR